MNLVTHVPPNFRDARKEIGLGMPPEAYGDNADMCLADQCDPRARIVVAEVARWRVDAPLADTTIGGPLADRINVWGTADGNPPPGITFATNTLATPGLFPCDMILRGIRVRVLVEPEARLIGGMTYNPGATASLPGAPDQWTQSDVAAANNALSMPVAGVAPTPAEILFGMSTWKSAYAFVNAYELVVGKDHQDQLIREPMTQVAHIEPFAEAEAAGLVFGSNQDQVNALNARLITIGQTFQFMGTYFKRLGAIAVATAAPNNTVSIFTPSREQDGSMTMFGAIGVTQYRQADTFLFTTPMFWPAGHSMAIFFDVNDQFYQTAFQRWLSVTGGSGGAAGTDLALPFSNQIASLGGYTGISPGATGANIMLEQTLDVTVPPINTTQQVTTTRAILKLGTMVFEVAAIGMRMNNPKWGPVVAKAIKQGAISAPRGYGNLAYMFQ